MTPTELSVLFGLVNTALTLALAVYIYWTREQRTGEAPIDEIEKMISRIDARIERADEKYTEVAGLVYTLAGRTDEEMAIRAKQYEDFSDFTAKAMSNFTRANESKILVVGQEMDRLKKKTMTYSARYFR